MRALDESFIWGHSIYAHRVGLVKNKKTTTPSTTRTTQRSETGFYVGNFFYRGLTSCLSYFFGFYFYLSCTNIKKLTKKLKKIITLAYLPKKPPP